MALVPVREAKGMNLMAPTISSRKKEPSSQVNPLVYDRARYTAPKLMDGIRYGRKARSDTSVAALLPRLRATA